MEIHLLHNFLSTIKDCSDLVNTQIETEIVILRYQFVLCFCRPNLSLYFYLQYRHDIFNNDINDMIKLQFADAL